MQGRILIGIWTRRRTPASCAWPNKYYRIMYRGSVEAWHIRDRHLFEMLQHLVAGGRKAVVWARNSHIGHAGATATGWEGEFNIGELAKTAYHEAVVVDFGTNRGTVAAVDDRDEPMQVMHVRPVRKDSHDALFREAGLPRIYLDLREPGAGVLREAWTAPCRAASVRSARSTARAACCRATASRLCCRSSSMPMSGSRRRTPSCRCRPERSGPASARPFRPGHEHGGARITTRGCGSRAGSQKDACQVPMYAGP